MTVASGAFASKERLGPSSKPDPAPVGAAHRSEGGRPPSGIWAAAGPSGRLASLMHPEEENQIPIGGGHHVLAKEVAGEMRLGVASEFTQLAHIAETLLQPTSPLSAQKRARVQKIRSSVRAAERRMDKAKRKHHILQEAAVQVRIEVLKQARRESMGGSERPSVRSHPAVLKIRRMASQALFSYMRAQRKAINLAKESIDQLWAIGKDFLPTNLMPVGEIFKDKATFAGDQATYTYHTGTAGDPIPITWYKRPADYPQLRLADGTIKSFPNAFTIDGTQFGLSAPNIPQVDWLLQKTAHNETRARQQELNQVLIQAGVQVWKDGAWRSPPLGDTHQFDGDHVKDLGFGGTDTANNYWPLDSTINRRAFNGYNSGYVINYTDGSTHKSRSIGGLIGKWFVVKRFLAPADGAIPDDGEMAGGS